MSQGYVEPMSSISVVGYGRIGSVLTDRLTSAGHRVTVCDVVAGRRPLAERAGARWAGTIADAVADADVVFTVLPGAAELQQAVIADQDLVPHLPASSTWIDLTSASVEVGRLCAAQADTAGIEYLDAPLGGGVEAVRDGTAVVYVGGRAEVLDRSREVLGSFAGQIHHVGDSGSGHLMKLLINTIWFGQAVLVTETLLLARRHGLAPARASELLRDSAADSAFVRRHLPALLDGDYLADFGLDRCLEELEAVERTAASSAVPHPLISAVTEVHRRALEHYGPVDGELLGAAWLEDRAGVRLSDG